MAKTLTKLDGTVINLGKGRPKKNWEKLTDGNYKELPDVVTSTEETVKAADELMEKINKNKEDF